MRGRKIFGGLFCVGVLAGILYLNLEKSVLLEQTGLWDETMLERIGHMRVQGSALFASILYRRSVRFFEIAILATTYLGYIVSIGAAVGYGFTFGAYLAAAVLRKGWRGVVVALAGVLPQGILYGILLYGLCLWCRRTWCMIYGRGEKTPALAERVLTFLLLFGILVAGCALESFLNPALLQKAVLLCFP